MKTLTLKNSLLHNIMNICLLLIFATEYNCNKKWGQLQNYKNPQNSYFIALQSKNKLKI